MNIVFYTVLAEELLLDKSSIVSLERDSILLSVDEFFSFFLIICHPQCDEF